MQIIFGKEVADQVRTKHLVAELDTFPEGTAYCVLELLPMEDLADLDRLMGLHQAVVDAWNKQDYSTVAFGIEHVYGKFGGQLDSFYDVLKDRLKGLQIEPA
jgi:hypothetical protein